MRLLIDECVDERLRLLFPGHDCQTARFANLAGLKNGRLLEAAEAAGFDILITVDQNIPDQQNLAGRRISLMILRTNEPPARFGATGARRGFRATFDQARRRSENQVGACAPGAPRTHATLRICSTNGEVIGSS